MITKSENTDFWRMSHLEQVGAFSRSKATDVLDQALSVRVSDGTVHIHTNFIHPVYKLTVESTQKLLFHYMLLSNI